MSGVPRWAGPALVVAAVMVFLAGATLFASALTDRLAATQQHQARLLVLQRQANAGLAELEPKLRPLEAIRRRTHSLNVALAGTDRNLRAIGGGVDDLNRRLRSIARGLAGISSGVATLEARTGRISKSLGGISTHLDATGRDVARLAVDVAATATALHGFPTALGATNSRLHYVNRVVGGFGAGGIHTPIHMTVKINGGLVGTADVDAVVLPRGAWRPK